MFRSEADLVAAWEAWMGGEGRRDEPSEREELIALLLAGRGLTDAALAGGVLGAARARGMDPAEWWGLVRPDLRRRAHHVDFWLEHVRRLGELDR
ncbi:MAG: hypothetical protein Q8Q14_06385 [Gemmatimonadales bacterium]|nr:hypothetical protein [Gemmatimonadales bacterium]